LNLHRRTPPDFDFATAVGSYGFFALAPNEWEPKTLALTTVVHAADTVLCIRLRPARCAGRDVLSINVFNQSSRREAANPESAAANRQPALSPPLSPAQRDAIHNAVGRMLRLDENLTPFHDLCAADPQLRPIAERRFGRLLRSESLFEDIVKTMCTCNITWRQTVSIVRRLVERHGTPAANEPARRAFPTPDQLASVKADELKSGCGLGYRSEWVHTLARQVADGSFDLGRCENEEMPTDELYKLLRTIRGVGDYAASSVCMLLGRYDRLAIDTELIKHYRDRFPRRKPTPTNIRKHYARFCPHDYLVYWWELWNRYRDETGHPTSWTADGE